ncbi:MAG: folate-binding protein [Lysobacterales bacterium]|nr:MAG: folate-binding protein [Xanthomonadales bacterium]
MPSPSPVSLPFLALLRCAGPDAVSFLQGQLTNDTRLLADGRTQLAALNTPQGRVVAVLRLRATPEAVYALVPADLADAVLARLRKFVMRAKVDLGRADDLRLVGCAAEEGAPARDVPGSVVEFRWSRDRTVQALPADSGFVAAVSAADAWRAADVAAGLPQIDSATSESFVAQMLNLDVLDGISFTKGCYTGQEIVARTQNLGRIKRRTLRYRITDGEPPAPLAALLADGAKVAEVLVSAPAGTGCELLAVTSLEARGRALVTDDGRTVEPLPLPYALPGDA